jgi:hypothetical protein
MESRFGQMELSMRVTGKTIKLMAEDSSGMQMEMCLMENGKKTKHMGMGYTLM